MNVKLYDGTHLNTREASFALDPFTIFEKFMWIILVYWALDKVFHNVRHFKKKSMRRDLRRYHDFIPNRVAYMFLAVPRTDTFLICGFRFP